MSSIQNVTSSRPLVQVDGRIVNQNVDKQGSTTLNLENGERFSGKIISMSDEGGAKTVQIKLADDVVISAKLNEQMPLKEGQYLSFEVRGFSNNQITLTPLYENTSVNPTVLKALSQAGLEPSNENVNMVKSMMENGMSIDKESLNNMHKIVSENSSTEPSTLVQMKALNIPINDQNIVQFESYKNYQHQVVNTMSDIMDELPNAYNQLVSDGKESAANDMYGDILKMLAEGASGMTEGSVTATTSEAVSEEQLMAEGDAAKEQVLVKGEDGKAANAETVLNETISKEGVASETAESGTSAVQNNSSQSALETQAPDKGSIISDSLQEQDAGKNAVNNQNQNNVTLSNDFANVIKELNTSSGLTGPETTKLLLQAEGKSTALIDEDALLKELAEAYSKSENNTEAAKEAFGKLFKSDDFNKLMKDSMRNQWLLDPSEVSDKENVENLYNRLNTQAKQLAETITKNLGADSKAFQSATSLQNNIDFMNQLNNMFHYVQLPLKMADQNANGELYVYSNGKRKFEPGETVSAILHLDMDNLGPLDVYVKMKDNNVKTNFYVADEGIIDLIEEHIDVLNERLNKRGYKMEAKTMLHTDMDNDSEDAAVSEMLNIRKMPVISMQSFDARA